MSDKTHACVWPWLTTFIVLLFPAASFPSGYWKLHHKVIRSHYLIKDAFVKDFCHNLLGYWNINWGQGNFIIMVNLTSLCVQTLAFLWLSFSVSWAFSENKRWQTGVESSIKNFESNWMQFQIYFFNYSCVYMDRPP